MDPHRLILLGEIVSAHGIKGEVKILSYTTRPEDIASYHPLRDKTGEHIFKIESLRVVKSSVIAKLSGVEDRTSAEKLKKTGLYVRRSQLPPPEPGAYYEEDLIGLEALSENGLQLGKVLRLQDFGAGPLLEIASSSLKEPLLVPFETAFVPKVDLEHGTITIIPPVFLAEDKEIKP